MMTIDNDQPDEWQVIDEKRNFIDSCWKRFDMVKRVPEKKRDLMAQRQAERRRVKEQLKLEIQQSNAVRNASVAVSA